jgi:hypothetical protein
VSLFDKPDTLLLLARDGDELLGYALTHVLPVEETWILRPAADPRP